MAVAERKFTGIHRTVAHVLLIAASTILLAISLQGALAFQILAPPTTAIIRESVATSSRIRRNSRSRTSTTTTTRLCLDIQSPIRSDVARSTLLPSDAYDTIQQGRIAVIPNFLSPNEVHLLRTDAQQLWDDGKFSTDALASYGQSGQNFDVRKDRAVLKLNQWKDASLGNFQIRGSASSEGLGYKMAQLRKELAYQLDRPQLDQGLATTKYGAGSTEISYTRFGPGAFLKRHVDEHHEELKGTAGWSQPTRRSISWLVYLNPADSWNSLQDGGQIRCFHRRPSPVSSSSPPHPQTNRIGAQRNGDLQIGWLRATLDDPMERPVFLDGHSEEAGHCAMYVMVQDNNNANNYNSKALYVTDKFPAHPTLYMGGAAGEILAKQLISKQGRGGDMAARFYFIETPKTLFRDIEMRDYDGSGEMPLRDERAEDVDPTGGTLVLFDSVTLPHEVLATRNNKTRWATSGWFHEDQQPPLLLV
jgi:Rps23 Pro-64 3,4-dihydroxylase Tpa1-like proline 4-hydroxylase